MLPAYQTERKRACDGLRSSIGEGSPTLVGAAELCRSASASARMLRSMPCLFMVRACPPPSSLWLQGTCPAASSSADSARRSDVSLRGILYKAALIKLLGLTERCPPRKRAGHFDATRPATFPQGGILQKLLKGAFQVRWVVGDHKPCLS